MAVALNHIVPLRIFLVAIKVVSSVLMAVENLITINFHLTILRLSKAISVQRRLLTFKAHALMSLSSRAVSAEQAPLSVQIHL